jgi:hypothetical protein
MILPNALIVGAGPMAIEYSKVLDHIKVPYSVKGRGKASADIYEKATGKEVALSWDEVGPLSAFTHCIVAVSEESLLNATLELVNLGAKKILVEKPGGPSIEEIEKHEDRLTNGPSEIYVAYNRRYYKIVEKLMEYVAEDGGITSLHFDFSERSRIVESLVKAPGVKENWLFHNSTHVIDLANYICNGLSIMSAQNSGSLEWHPAGARFAGLGQTRLGNSITYNSDWEAPGGWEVLVRTRSRRLSLKPLETLTITNLEGEVLSLEEHEFTKDGLKPGIEGVVEDFLSPNPSRRLTPASDVVKNLYLYKQILNSSNGVAR